MVCIISTSVSTLQLYSVRGPMALYLLRRSTIHVDVAQICEPVTALAVVLFYTELLNNLAIVN